MVLKAKIRNSCSAKLRQRHTNTASCSQLDEESIEAILEESADSPPVGFGEEDLYNMSPWFGWALSTATPEDEGVILATQPVSLAQAFGAKEAPEPVSENSVNAQPEGDQQNTFNDDAVTELPWYQCLLPDCSGGTTDEAQNEMLHAEAVEESRQDETQDVAGIMTISNRNASSPYEELRDGSFAEERHDDANKSPTTSTTSNDDVDGEHRRTRSEPNESDGLPDTFFSTGSFESISGLSLASYGTTASAMLGGFDYDEQDEKVLTNFLDDKDDDSVVEGEEIGAVETPVQPSPPPPTSISAQIESRRQQNLQIPAVHCESNTTDDDDHASVSTGTTRSSRREGASSRGDDYSVISEDASMVSALNRDRELNSIPLRKIKLMFKEGGMSDEERKHMLDLRSAIKSFGRHDLNVAHILVTTGDYYADESDYSKALSLHEEAFSIYSTKLGDHDSRSVDSKLRIARVQLMHGNVDDAMETFCQTIHMREALLGEEHPSVGEVRMHVAEIQRGKGHPKEAAREVKKALRGYREVYGDDHPIVADAVESIADLYTEMGDHEKANLIFSEIVKLRAAIDGHEAISVSKALIKWSWSFESLGNTSRALKLMKQAYSALVKQEGIAGATTAEALEGVGKIYATIGRKDKAIKAYTRVLNIRRQTLGENHPATAATFVTIGKTLRDVDQPDKSLKCMKRAMSIYSQYEKNKKKNEKSEDDATISDSLHQIGLTFEDHGENTLALKAFSREMSLRKSAHYCDKRRVARVLNAIGVIQCKRGKFKNAIEFFTEALVNMDSTGGRNATFAATLFNVGLALEKMGETEKAFQTYAETLMMYKVEGLGEENPMVSKVINKIKKNPNVEIEVPVAINGQLPCTLLDDRNKFEC